MVIKGTIAIIWKNAMLDWNVNKWNGTKPKSYIKKSWIGCVASQRHERPNQNRESMIFIKSRLWPHQRRKRT